MQNVRFYFVLFVIFSIIIIEIEGVDKSKFKSCNDSGFCRRNRQLTSPENPQIDAPSPFELDKSSFTSLSNNKKTSGVLRNQHDKVEFNFDVFAYDNNVVRIRVSEREPLYPRYEVRDVLIEDFLEAHQAQQTLIVQENKAHITFDNADADDSKMVIDFETGQIDLFSSADDVMPSIRMNERGLLYFEHSRAPLENPTDSESTNTESKDFESTNTESKDFESTNTESKYRTIDSNDGGWSESFGSHHDGKPHGPQSIGSDFTFVSTNYVYGIPEHATDLSLKPTRGENIQYQEPYRLYNLDVFEYELDNPMALYGSVPIMIGHRPERTVGVFWMNAAETWVDVEKKDGNTQTHWFSESGVIDVFFLLGGESTEHVFHQIAAITGHPELPPLFSIAYHQCRWNYKSETDVLGVDSNFDLFDIPYDVIWLDIEHTDGKRYLTWDNTNFPTPKDMINAVAEKGRRMVTIVDPHIKRDNAYTVHKQASDHDYYVHKSDGSGSAYDNWCWPGSSSWVDFTSPVARYWWEELFSYDRYEGSTETLFIWNDMNEPSVFNGPEVTMHKDALHHNDWEHRDLHNIYGLLCHRATALGLVKRNPAHSERPFVLSRAFYAGTQRWGAVWTGDNAAQWSHLEASQPMIMSIGLVGIPFAGADVGGFFGDPDEALLTRWYQAGAFQPFFRAHGHLDTARREPYLFSKQTVDNIRYAIRQRYAFLPYLYSEFHYTSIHGTPIMRPLWVNYPHDKTTFGMDNHFMLGKDLLVRPIIKASESNAPRVGVYLPGGRAQQWYDIHTLKTYQGPYINYPLESDMSNWPVFQRGGSIIARKERTRRSTTQMLHDPYTLNVALNGTLEDAHGTLYIDDFHSFNYKNQEQYAIVNFHYDASKRTLSSHIVHEHEAFKTHARIERIRLIGLDHVPNSIEQETQNGENKVLSFFVDRAQSHDDSVIVTIRKPWTLITNAFTIFLK